MPTESTSPGRVNGPATAGSQSEAPAPGPGAWASAALLLAVAVLSYGFWIPRLGLYWDDWWLIWAAETGGPARLLDGLVGERLLHGWMYVLATWLYDASPVALHLAVLATRVTAGLAAWWTVRAIWPERGREALAVALLMVVYPGFSQQSMALIYSDYFLTLTFFLVSLGGMLWALRRPGRFWWLMAAALIAAIPAHWVLEYWLGLELLRLPLAIWVAAQASRTGARAWRRGAAVTAPFYGNVAVKVVVAMMVERSARMDQTLGGYLAAIARDPVKELIDRAGYVATDLADAIVFAWTRTLGPEMLGMRLRYTLAGLLIAVLAAALTALWLRGADPPGRDDAVDAGGRRWPWIAMGVGLGAILVGQLPLWITDRQIEWHLAALDRHALPAMLGSALFLVGLGRGLAPRGRGFVAAMAVLVGIGAAFQFRQGHAYWQEHERQASFMWQWYWRAPGLEPGTSVFLHHRPVSLPQPKDYTYAVPMNLAWDPGYESGPVRYWLFPDADGFPPYWLMLLSGGDPELGRELQGLVLAGSGTGGAAELERRVRNLTFEGSTDRSVVALHRPPGCVRVLDPSRDEVVDVPPAVRDARLRSRPERIRSDGAPVTAVLTRFYGPEPEHGWCYHYQKAELARQLGEWDRVAELADRVRAEGLRPADDREWTTFIEGYARVGRASEARALVREVVPYTGTIWNLHDRYARGRAFCALEDRLAAAGVLDGPGSDIFDLGADRILSCSAPDPEERRGR